MISSNSATASELLGDWPVNRERESEASLRRPTLISQRGDSGEKNVPMAKIKAHAN